MTDKAVYEWRTSQLYWGELADDQNKDTWIKCLKVQYQFWTNLSFGNVVFQPLNSNLLAGTYYPSVIAKNPEKLHISSQTAGVSISAAWGCCKGCAIQFCLYWRCGRWEVKIFPSQLTPSKAPSNAGLLPTEEREWGQTQWVGSIPLTAIIFT